MTTITDLQKAESDVDNVLAQINAKQSTASQDNKMGASAVDVVQDLSLVVEGGIAILKGVKILLWWKPSWKTSIDNLIAFLETFLVPDVAPVIPVSPVTPAASTTAAFYNPDKEVKEPGA